MAVGNRTLKVVKYALLPQFLPRIASLFFSGFHYFAFFMAQIYRGARLLPAGHPYLNPSEVGHYSIPDVIGAAGRHLVFRKQNIDQIIIYFVILLGLVLMVLQALFMLVSVFAPQAIALSLDYYFGTQTPASLPGFDSSQDLAFILLDRVFGVKGIFDSCVSTAVSCFRSSADGAFEAGNTVYKPAVFPWPYHEALHAMFNFYSTGLLIVGMMILMYFVIVIVAETAQTGTPFGKRFNKLWAPLRLVVALGLLIPISSGLNSAQFIVLYAAKYGSNFGTNGWLVFNSKLQQGMPTGNSEIIAKPQSPNPRELVQFMMLAHACKAVEEGFITEPFNDKWAHDNNCTSMTIPEEQFTYVDAYLVRTTGDPGTDSLPLSSTPYWAVVNGALDFFDKGDITIRFGDRGCTAEHNTYSGHVIPLCGELTMANATIDQNVAGAFLIQGGYYDLVKYMWGDYNNPGVGGTPDRWSSGKNGVPAGYCDPTEFATMSGGKPDIELWKRSIYNIQQTCPSPQDLSIQTQPEVDWLAGSAESYRIGDGTLWSGPGSAVGTVAGFSPPIAGVVVENIIRDGLTAERAYVNGGGYQIPMDSLSRGWGGAGMWYNRIAQGNGVMTAAAWELPKVSRYPKLMNDILAAKTRNMPNVTPSDIMGGSKGQDTSLQTNRAGDAQAVTALGDLYTAWTKVEDPQKKLTGNTLNDFINMVFGSQGLFDMRDPANQNVHPLALLTALGKGLVEASIRNIIIGMGGQLAQIMSTSAGFSAGSEAAKAFASMAYNVATMTLMAGFILYYILPFLPFVYFFFAVGNWVKGIFEAMVGVPLWALAHIRIDGDGLPGPAALNGYFMIFEIFLRPILIVFGLVAAVTIFAAMASVFNSIFPLAVNNLGGLNYKLSTNVSWLETARGPLDQLFYTVMYAVIMYVMALASFKLIDQIPGSILRWMGSSIVGFQGGGDDAAGSLTNMAQQGSHAVTQATTGMKNMGHAGDSLAKGLRGQ